MFLSDSDAVHFSCVKDGDFLPVAHSWRFSPDLSCSGLVAARSGRTCHLASSLLDKTSCPCSTAPSTRNLARPRHLNMTWGSVNVYSMTASPLCSVWASSHCAWRNTSAADTDVQRPGDRRSNPAPFYFYTFSHTSHIHHINWMSVEEGSFFPKSLCRAWCHIMQLDRILFIYFYSYQ